MTMDKISALTEISVVERADDRVVICVAAWPAHHLVDDDLVIGDNPWIVEHEVRCPRAPRTHQHLTLVRRYP